MSFYHWGALTVLRIGTRELIGVYFEYWGHPYAAEVNREDIAMDSAIQGTLIYFGTAYFRILAVFQDNFLSVRFYRTYSNMQSSRHSTGFLSFFPGMVNSHTQIPVSCIWHEFAPD